MSSHPPWRGKYGLRVVPVHEPEVSASGMTSVGQDVIDSYMSELVALRGTPELVDRLESLVASHPGIETNMNLYRALYPFKLDAFQEQGLTSIMGGNNVLVTTPTGSGKTVVSELAIYFALMMGLRVAYTTPLKALSNQKFQDFKAKYGGDRVGLLTGDIAINRGAAITIMTTEVFRNMIYDPDSENQLSNLFMVCFDEFHFMNDPDRGTVWEESVISCPQSVRILALSATMGNVAEIKGWMQSIHGPTDLVQSFYRPVPLRYMFAMRQGLMPLFRDPNAGPGASAGIKIIEGGDGKQLDPGSTLNPTIIKMEEQVIQSAQKKQTTKTGRQFKTARVNPNTLIPRYSDVAEELHSLKLLPAIVFIFSRAGCEQSAKSVMQTSTKLLTDEEVLYVSRAINQFAKQNPEIPVSRAAVQSLRAGVGVHHAGLIPVWKAFIEDLFNANKIKVLFATETLAAGVNMPARTTVISTVTKRINSEVVKLKTSQLLQMAGRAGRRGLDTEGTVVVMRNRFEDARVGHKILVSPVDGIKSHFKTSYGLVVKLLETRSLEACKELIQRGFGSYLLSMKIQRKTQALQSDSSTMDEYRQVLQKYTLKSSRDYLKLARRLEKERSNYEYLEQKLHESSAELVQAIADYMPLGIGLQLRDGSTGFFLGDVRGIVPSSTSGNVNVFTGLEAERKLQQKSAKILANGFGVITAGPAAQLLVVRKEHIVQFAEPEDCLPLARAQALVDVLLANNGWGEFSLTASPSVIGLSSANLGGEGGGGATALRALQSIDAAAEAAVNKSTDTANAAVAVAQALAAVRSSQEALPRQELPGSLIRQREVVAELERELSQSAIQQAGEGNLVLEALRYAASLRDPMGFINGSPRGGAASGGGTKGGDFFAWRMFQSSLAVLGQFKALETGPSGATKATNLGQVVGSLNSDNELWLALVVLHPAVQGLKPEELAAIICGVVIDGHKFSTAFFRRAPSENTQQALAALELTRQELLLAQSDAGVDFPVCLSTEMGGLVETWAAGGITWRELCKDTSLDQGDVCRLLRRTVDALRQVPVAFGVSPEMARAAADAADKIDRFPVADADSAVAVSGAVGSGSGGGGSGSGSGARSGRGFAPGVGDAEGETDVGEAGDDNAWLLDENFDGDDIEGEEGGFDAGLEGADGLPRELFPWTAQGLKGGQGLVAAQSWRSASASRKSRNSGGGDVSADSVLDEFGLGLDSGGTLDLDKLLGLGLGLSDDDLQPMLEAAEESEEVEQGEAEAEAEAEAVAVADEGVSDELLE